MTMIHRVIGRTLLSNLPILVGQALNRDVRSLQDVARIFEADELSVLTGPEALAFAVQAGLYENTHSWAGSEGRTARLLRDGKSIGLACGGWYSDNGNISDDAPPVNLAVAISRSGAEPGEIIVIIDWMAFNGRHESKRATFLEVTRDILDVGRLKDVARKFVAGFQVATIAREFSVLPETVQVLSEPDSLAFVKAGRLYRNEHSSAGTEGRMAYLRGTNRLTLPYGGWYFANGVLTSDFPAVNLAVALYRARVRPGAVVVVKAWCAMNRDSTPVEIHVFKVTQEMIDLGRAVDGMCM